MKKQAIPFNLGIQDTSDRVLQNVKPVRVLDIFQGATKDFHNDGLFSAAIFGRVGDPARNLRFSYIDLKVPVMHPLVYNTLVNLKQLYGEILTGKAYAVWDKGLKDFVKSDQTEGATGYAFFAHYWKDIVFENRDSDARELNIKFIEKFKDKAMTSKLLVLPAGLRDYEIEESGKESENEFNDLYRRALAISNSISAASIRTDIAQINGSRMALQRTFNEIYALFESMIEGKKKFIMGKWAARAVHYGTRNVITSTNVRVDTLGSDASVGFNDTVVGLFQYLKATQPVTIYQLRKFLEPVFPGPNAPAYLVNKKTLKKEVVKIKPKYYDNFMTAEGLEKMISIYGEESLRHKELELEGFYLGLLYKGEGVYKFIQDIDDLPEHLKKEDVFPITFTELMYLAVYKNAKDYPALTTRYPVTGYGSIYPSYVYLKPTVHVETRAPLGVDWLVDSTQPVAYNFPTKSAFFNSMSPAANRLARLGGDFDGDMMSLIVLFTEESKATVKKKLASRNFYVGTDGQMSFSVVTDTVKFLMKSLTGKPIN